MPPYQEFTRCLSPCQRNLFSLHCLDFHAEERLSQRWPVGQPCENPNSWESHLWHDAGVPLDFTVESASSWDVAGKPGILSRPSRERIPHLELRGRKGAPLDVGRTLVLPLEWRRVCRGNSWVEARVWRTLWKFQTLGVFSLEKPQRKWASSRLEGRTSWIFSSYSRYSRLTTGTSGNLSGGHRTGQSPCELLGGFSRFLSRRCRGLRPSVESGPEPKDYSPVLKWILGYFWSFHWGVDSLLVWGHARALSSRAVPAVSGFPLRGSRDLWLSLEDFPRGFTTRLSN